MIWRVVIFHLPRLLTWDKHKHYYRPLYGLYSWYRAIGLLGHVSPIMHYRFDLNSEVLRFTGHTSLAHSFCIADAQQPTYFTRWFRHRW